MLFPFTVAHVRNFRKLSLTISLKLSCIYCPQLQMDRHRSRCASHTVFLNKPHSLVFQTIPSGSPLSYLLTVPWVTMYIFQTPPSSAFRVYGRGLGCGDCWALLALVCQVGGALSSHFSASYLFSTSMCLILTVPQENWNLVLEASLPSEEQG